MVPAGNSMQVLARKNNGEILKGDIFPISPTILPFPSRNSASMQKRIKKVWMALQRGKTMAEEGFKEARPIKPASRLLKSRAKTTSSAKTVLRVRFLIIT